MLFNEHCESTMSQGNYLENKAGKENVDSLLKSSLYLYMTFNGAGPCGNYIFSGELRKCHYYC